MLSPDQNNYTQNLSLPGEQEKLLVELYKEKLKQQYHGKIEMDNHSSKDNGSQHHGHAHKHGNCNHEKFNYFNYPEPDSNQLSLNSLLYGSGHEQETPYGWTIDQSKSRQNNTVNFSKDRYLEKNNFWLFNIFNLFDVRIVKDSNGIWQAFLVLFFWSYGNWSIFAVILWPNFVDGNLSIFILLAYSILSLLCLASFIRVATMDPGSFSPIELQYSVGESSNVCQVCRQIKPPSIHHCRRCGHCLKRMDHHCPWINNCVAEGNQFVFMLLIVYTLLLSVFILLLISWQIFVAPDCLSCAKESITTEYKLIILLITTALAFICISSMSALMYNQHINIIFSTSTLDLMSRKNEKPYPTEEDYEKRGPSLERYKDVFGSEKISISLLLPCRKRNYENLKNFQNNNNKYAKLYYV